MGRLSDWRSEMADGAILLLSTFDSDVCFCWTEWFDCSASLYLLDLA